MKNLWRRTTRIAILSIAGRISVGANRDAHSDKASKLVKLARWKDLVRFGSAMRRHIIIAFFGTAGMLTGQLSAHAQTFFTYRCNDGSEFIAAFYEGDTRAHLQLDGKAVALSKRMSVSGSRYAKGDTTLRITKTGTTLKRGKRLTECSVR